MGTKLTAVTESTTNPVDTDLFLTTEDVATTPVSKRKPWSTLKAGMKAYFDTLYAGKTHMVRGTIVDPQAVYTKRAQLPIFRADAALTITRIHIACNDYSPTAELAGDLKWATDLNDGSFADAAVIDVCDTTSGVFTVTTGMDDPTIPSGKYVYFSFDASPHADIDEIYIEIYYTYD